MINRYIVVVADCAGPFWEEGRPTLAEARTLEASLRARWPKKSVNVHDNERDGRAVEDNEEEPNHAA